MAATSSKKSAAPSRATKEGNARAGYCASAFFATAGDIPAAVSKSLPDDEFCTIDDLVKGIKRVENQLLAINPTPGQHYVLLRVKDARDLILTLVLSDTSIGLDDTLDPTPVIASEHNILNDTVLAVKKVISAAQHGTLSYEEIRKQLDNLPNAALTNSILALLGQRVPTIQSLVGPIDLNIGKLAVKQVPSDRDHYLQGRVVGGYEEQVATVSIEVSVLDDADPRLFTVGNRITLKVVQEEHRVSLLLAQLAKMPIRVQLKIPRIPITLSPLEKSDLRCDLVHVEVLNQPPLFEEIRANLARQLNLEL